MQAQISQLLRSRSCLGEIPHNGEWHPGRHEPIIDTDLFNAVQGLLARFPDYEVVEDDLAREVSEFHVGWAWMPVRPGGRTVTA